ncbi:MAG: alcohol dehydrogenase catalytic domain-containing protein [Clostridia bacterium]|nr:alcohol dehydrogenase catalytic domain-containing protein [Clostridia bacterium]
MINYIYQLTRPGCISVKYEDVKIENEVVIRPTYMAICQADQRYYRGLRDISKLKNKLPMALIHESMGEILCGLSNTFSCGQKVVMIPNVKSKNNDKEIYENYQKGSSFLSSGKDGFMREFVNLNPDRVVPIKSAPGQFAAISEFISVGVHGVSRLKKFSHGNKKSFGVWGDGSLAYVVSCIIKENFPDAKLYVIWRDSFKLSQFLFADGTYFSGNIPEDFNIDHAFECAGGEGSFYAIDDIIKYINPQGTAVLMGVSEYKIAVNTRDILEKGLTLIGSSRSGREDFEKAVEFLEKNNFQKRISRIIYEDSPVKTISDIHRVFETDLKNPFKTVFKWDL